MKLYRFDFYNHEIQREVLEAEEKPKTYLIRDLWNTRINKSDIGIPIGYCFTHSVYLLEDDMEKAKEIFRSLFKRKIEEEKQRITDAEKNIRKYEEDINVNLKACVIPYRN